MRMDFERSQAMSCQLRRSRRSFMQAAGAAGLSLVIRGASSAEERDISWLRDVQRPPAVLPPDAPKLSDILVDDSGKRITTSADWAQRRASLKKWWLDFLGPMPAERKSPPSLTVVEEDSTDGVIRQL